MKVYILTMEPFGDNSRVLEVYLEHKTALDALANSPNIPLGPIPDYFNPIHFKLEKWDIESNKLEELYTNQRYANQWIIEEHIV